MSGPTSFLTSDDLAKLNEHGTVNHFVENEIIIQQDMIANHLHLVQSGIVQIDLSRLFGTQVLAFLGEGAMFGEVSLMDHEATSATASAKQACDVLMVPHEVVEKLLAEDEGFAARFFRTVATTLATRLRSTNTSH